ncbi:MAG: glutamine-hydrolyzing GMP synthase [Chlamydiae bacterium]|nr:glutamine-hydrolyzing GMP synthase [Chlamydiota bacterium]MBI3266142.1 glutamine-hydrolyzing GMP synthase [Chlamydiota bacterium]
MNQSSIEKELIAILDFGSQYTQLIARRIRENGVFSRVFPCHVSFEEIKKLSPKGIVLSGGPSSVYEKGAPQCDERIFKWGVPVLGICYGMQLMAQLLGAKVTPSGRREYGKAELLLDDPDILLEGLSRQGVVWMSHGDQVSEAINGFKVLAHTSNTSMAALGDQKRKLYGLQFHPEVVHTEEGAQIIQNFLFKICECSKSWDMKSFVQNEIAQLKKRLARERVICGLSGGVDSSVTAMLLHQAIGDQLVCIFVNNGLLRLGEAEKVIQTFQNHFHIDLVYADASEKFLKNLEGVTDPELKRKKIGETFIRVFEEEVRKLGKVKFLAQGTLYPDVIESVSAFGGPSATIKTHHNVGGLPKDLAFELVEPLRDLFKDEVRLLGKELGMSDEILMRQPFPGPGLAIRVIGEVTKERLEILRKADVIVMDEIRKAEFYRKVWQSFAVLLPVKTVGVMGDGRTYENVIALRVVSSLDGMTADWVRLPYDLLAQISNRIINEVKGINRVVYDISSKPPSTIEWE